MAGGLQTFVALTKPTAAQLNIVSQQGIMTFDDVADRDAQVTAPTQGMYCVTIDADTLWYHDGTEWQAAMASEPTPVTPSWNNLSPGAATQVADIQSTGLKQLRYKGQIVLAADSTISGNITLDIPESLTAMGTPARGVAVYNDVGTRIRGGTCGIAPSSTVIAFTHEVDLNGGLTNATSPFTFGTGDVIGWDITIGYV